MAVSNLEAVCVALRVHKRVKLRLRKTVIQTLSVKVLTCHSVYSEMSEERHAVLSVETTVTRQTKCVYRCGWKDGEWHHTRTRTKHELVRQELGFEPKRSLHGEH